MSDARAGRDEPGRKAASRTPPTQPTQDTQPAKETKPTKETKQAQQAQRAQHARDALAVAKADALARGNFPARPTRALPETGAAGDGRRERREDPQVLTAAINGLLAEQGWERAAATGALFGHWAQIVGADLAAHTTPESLADGELTVTADSTAWATQVRLLAGQLVRRLNLELGDGAVARVKVRGPAGAPRRPGEWRVRGGRGPRDTYG